MTDQEAIELFRKGNHRQKSEAFSLLYDRYAQLVRSYCLSMLSSADEAEDIFQETFIVLHSNLEKGTEIKYIKAFLVSIAKNHIRNTWRDRKNNVEIEPEHFSYDPAPAQNREEMMGLIKDALPLIDEKYREAFVLREFAGMPYQDIAEVLDMTLSGAKTRVKRAHERMLTILQPYIKELKLIDSE